jgi:hypothetical protein
MKMVCETGLKCMLGWFVGLCLHLLPSNGPGWAVIQSMGVNISNSFNLFLVFVSIFILGAVFCNLFWGLSLKFLV